MKKVINASIGGREFLMEEDAYRRITEYFRHFKSRLVMDSQLSSDEVMADVERRIAELFIQDTAGVSYRTICYDMVQRAVDQLGMPDGTPEPFDTAEGSGPKESAGPDSRTAGFDASYSDGALPLQDRKLFRDKDHRAISGVCSGLAAYFNIDTTIVRLATVLACLFWGTGVIVYIVMVIVVPMAKLPYEKCLMHGLSPTAENMARFAGNGEKSDGGK